MSHLTWRRMVWVSTLAAISSSLYAVDGVVLIDQNRALAGNVSPGDTHGFPVTISQPGSYRLSGNLTVPDSLTTAIQITANDVTLDLNGFSIIGPTVCTPNPTMCNFSGGGVGVHAGSFTAGVVAPNGVKVMNGTVRGMGFHGVRLIGDRTVVERVITYSNGGPGIVVGDGSVIDSVASLNGSGAAIVGTIVRGSTAVENATVGIFLRNNGVASGNIANANGSDGLRVTTGTVVGNTASNNKGFGIDATCPSSITGNTVVGNQSGSIRTTGVCTLANNAQ